MEEKGRECTKCGEYKEWDNFSTLKHGKNGKMSRCKKCACQYNKEVLGTKKLNDANRRYRGRLDGGVYKIKTSIGDYIGKSKHMKFRIIQHLTPSSNKHGITKENFKEWEVLEYIDSEAQRKIRERYWIDKLRPELNIR